MVAQESLELFVMVRIHAGQPVSVIWSSRHSFDKEKQPPETIADEGILRRACREREPAKFLDHCKDLALMMWDPDSQPHLGFEGVSYGAS
jgi:hypothetical protein